MIVGHVPVEDSLSKVTTGGTVKSSASVVTTLTFGAGTSPKHSKFKGIGLLAVGGASNVTVTSSVAVQPSVLVTVTV